MKKRYLSSERISLRFFKNLEISQSINTLLTVRSVANLYHFQKCYYQSKFKVRNCMLIVLLSQPHKMKGQEIGINKILELFFSVLGKIQKMSVDNIISTHLYRKMYSTERRAFNLVWYLVCTSGLTRNR